MAEAKRKKLISIDLSVIPDGFLSMRFVVVSSLIGSLSLVGCRSMDNPPKSNPMASASSEDSSNNRKIDVGPLLSGTFEFGKASNVFDKLNGQDAHGKSCSVTFSKKEVKIHVGGPEDGRGLDYKFDLTKAGEFYEPWTVKYKCPNGDDAWSSKCPKDVQTEYVYRTYEYAVLGSIADRRMEVTYDLAKKSVDVRFTTYQNVILRGATGFGAAACHVATKKL